MLRFRFRACVSTQAAIRLCSTTAGSSEGTKTNETQENENVEMGLEKRKSAGLDPSDDPVWEYARAALTRENREMQIEPVNYNEDSTYAPILAQGKKNVHELTTDIPAHVTPKTDWHMYQKREYFDMMRERKPLWRRVAGWLGIIGAIGAFIGTVTFTRVWFQQPKEIQAMRGEILSETYGRVLELGAGHGQNIGAYPYPVHEIVLADQSAQLLNQLRFRLPKTAYPKYEVRQVRVERLEEFEDESFDCVVDMFSLCHYRDPVMALRQMQRVVKPTGSIILLEHGRSPYFFVNWALDFFADRHNVNTHGCRWNLPMMEFFKEARLQIKELRNEHYGTTYYVIAYPENIDAVKADVAKMQDQ